MKPIDLGHAASGMTAQAPSLTGRDEKIYPTLWIEHKGDELELPRSGKMTISFVVEEKTERETEDGKEYSCRLRVKSIDGLEEDETDEPGDTTERDFDKAVVGYKKSAESEEED